MIMNIIDTAIPKKPEAAKNFFDYIYAGGVDASAATAKGLKWYNDNRGSYTPEQFIELWNQANYTKFTVADLDNALIQAGYAASIKTEKNGGGVMLPLLYAAAAFYFLG
jgi:hypothetical protein